MLVKTRWLQHHHSRYLRTNYTKGKRVGKDAPIILAARISGSAPFPICKSHHKALSSLGPSNLWDCLSQYDLPHPLCLYHGAVQHPLVQEPSRWLCLPSKNSSGEVHALQDLFSFCRACKTALFCAGKWVSSLDAKS